jgi:hypothetical protein
MCRVAYSKVYIVLYGIKAPLRHSTGFAKVGGSGNKQQQREMLQG